MCDERFGGLSTAIQQEEQLPGLSIARDPTPAPCTLGLIFDDPTLRYYPPQQTPSPAPACASCLGLDGLGLLRRVSPADASALRQDRVCLTCRTCRAPFIRPDGAA